MKANQTSNIISLQDANQGKAFSQIETSSLPVFRESDYMVAKDDERCELIANLRDVAFPSLPSECVIENSYSGILATDLFSLNTLLGSMIESKVVHFLNSHRSLWDDKGTWSEYHFTRANESFPDVRLVKKNGKANPILGIELKLVYTLKGRRTIVQIQNSFRSLRQW